MYIIEVCALSKNEREKKRASARSYTHTHMRARANIYRCVYIFLYVIQFDTIAIVFNIQEPRKQYIRNVQNRKMDV